MENEWRTFTLGIIAMVLAFIGSYLNMLPPDAFQNVMWAVLGAYSFKTVGKKFAAGYINKNNTEDLK